MQFKVHEYIPINRILQIKTFTLIAFLHLVFFNIHSLTHSIHETFCNDE